MSKRNEATTLLCGDGFTGWSVDVTGAIMSLEPALVPYLCLNYVCELLQFAATHEAGMVRAFCRPHAHTFNEQSKMATALTPQTDVTSEKVT